MLLPRISSSACPPPLSNLFPASQLSLTNTRLSNLPQLLVKLSKATQARLESIIQWSDAPTNGAADAHEDAEEEEGSSA